MSVPSTFRSSESAIGTRELLTAISEHGPHWPLALSQRTIEDISGAVRREIAAGNLWDGRTLTPQGAHLLRHAGEAPDTRAQLRIVGEGWELCCLDCGAVTGHGAADADDADVARAVDGCLAHTCPADERGATPLGRVPAEEPGSGSADSDEQWRTT